MSCDIVVFCSAFGREGSARRWLGAGCFALQGGWQVVPELSRELETGDLQSNMWNPAGLVQMLLHWTKSRLIRGGNGLQLG